MNQTQTQTLDSFTRILASESLVIQIDTSADTAYFIPDERTIVLPDWSHLDEDQQILLRSHEVGHALYTPAEGWHSSIRAEGKMFRVTLNIVEDARIERVLKENFPGLRKRFSAGYTKFYQEKLFGDVDQTKITTMGLLDRFNMYFKIGHCLHVPFSEKEQALVDEGKTITTFEQAVDLAKRLYQAAKEEAETAKEGMRKGKPKNGGEFGDGDGEAEDGEPSCETDQNSNDRAGKLAKKTNKNEATNIVLSNATAKSLAHHIVNIDIPVSDINRYADDMSRRKTSSTGLPKDDQHRLQVNSITGVINTFFEQYKAARNYERTRVYQTGSIDSSRLYRYSYNDDLFLSDELVKNGKNHGLVMILDFSGSMSDVMYNTMKQCLGVVGFCERQRIPFEVYAFYADYAGPSAQPSSKNEAVFDGGFQLLKMLSNEYGSAKNAALKRFFIEWARSSFNDSSMICRLGARYNSGSTPLVKTMFAVLQIMHEFKAKTRADVIHPVFFTDGMGDDGITVDGKELGTYKVLNMIDKINNVTLFDSEPGGASLAKAALKMMSKFGYNPTNFFVSKGSTLNYYANFFTHGVSVTYDREAFRSKGTVIIKDKCFGMKEVYMIDNTPKGGRGYAGNDKLVLKKFVDKICGSV